MQKLVYQRRVEKNTSTNSLEALAQVQGSFLYQKEVDTFLPHLSYYGSFLPNQTLFQSMKSKGLCGNCFPLLFLVSGCDLYNEIWILHNAVIT